MTLFVPTGDFFWSIFEFLFVLKGRPRYVMGGGGGGGAKNSGVSGEKRVGPRPPLKTVFSVQRPGKLISGEWVHFFSHFRDLSSFFSIFHLISIQLKKNKYKISQLPNWPLLWPPLHRENGQRISLSGKTQGIVWLAVKATHMTTENDAARTE